MVFARAASPFRAERSRERRMLDVSRVTRGCRLEDQDLRLFVGNRAVLDPARHDDELAGIHVDRTIAKLDTKAAMHPEEELVLRLVMVPDELPAKLDELDLLAVQLSHDFGPPVFGDQRELFGKIDL